MNTGLIRWSPTPRIASTGATLAADDFITIASHDYHIYYHAGTHYGRTDYATTCRIDLDQEVLVIELELEEPNPAAVREALDADSSGDFWATDFAALNFVDADDRVVQLGVKADGAAAVFRAYEAVADSGIEFAITAATAAWRAAVRLPLAFLGFDAEALTGAGIPFDVVRFHQGNGAISAWCPIPDQLPFLENYRFPVFCFGRLTAGDPDVVDVGPRDIGSFDYDGPAAAGAGEYIRFAVTYTAGKHGLQPGAALRFTFRNEVIECNRRTSVFRRFPEKDWSRLQWENPAAPGFIQAVCSAAGAALQFVDDVTFGLTAVVEAETALAPGETITLEVGMDARGPGMRTQLLHQERVPLKICVDPLGNGIFHCPPAFPTIDVLGGPAQALLVHTPPTPDPDESFRLVVCAVDSFGNVAHGYDGTIRFYDGEAFAGLPVEYSFSPADRGIAVFETAVSAAGQYLLRVVDTAAARINGVSNPIVTDGSFGPDKIFFGDVHTHTQCSDGRLPLEQKYRELALHRGCDFWCLTDHAYDLTTERTARIKEVLAAHNEDDRFVTIPGYEWTCSDGHGKPCARKMYGHRNVHFRGDMEVVCDGISPLSNTPQTLVDALNKTGQEYVVFNHFHCGDPQSFHEVDEGFEVSSWCGNWFRDTRADAKTFPHASLADLCDHGFRGAVVAGSDHGSEAYYTGLPAELTAVCTDRLTRDGVFDALKQGRTYATTGQKVLLRFTVNDVPPGRDQDDVAGAVRAIRITIGSALPVVGIQIVRNGENWRNLQPSTELVQTFEITDDDAATVSGYYYVRIRTAQGHVTWSSPVFFNTADEAANRED